MLLLIDNYDSFTHNLAQYFQILGVAVEVVYHDKISISQIETLSPRYLVISPGPGTPDEAGISCEAIRHFAGKLPILGVCLGHQCIAQVFGGKIVRAPKVMHGKTSMIAHQGVGLFAHLPLEFQVARYHSLVAQKSTLPNELEVSAWTVSENEEEASEIMGLTHKKWPIFGVQFHPEAILTEYGLALLNNFIKVECTN